MAVMITCDKCESPATVVISLNNDCEEEIGLWCHYCGADIKTPEWLILGLEDPWKVVEKKPHAEKE